MSKYLVKIYLANKQFNLLDLIRDNIFTIKITEKKNSMCSVKLMKRNLTLWYYLNNFARYPFNDTSGCSAGLFNIRRMWFYMFNLPKKY